jgi:hypothetical protein
VEDGLGLDLQRVAPLYLAALTNARAALDIGRQVDRDDILDLERRAQEVQTA